MGEIIRFWVEQVVGFFKTLWVNLKEIMPAGVANVMKVIEDFVGRMKDKFLGALDSIKEAFSSVFSWIGDTIGAVLGKISGAVGTVKNLIFRRPGANRTDSSVRGRATGGFVTENVTKINERGSELVELPRGSFVHTAQASQNIMRGGVGGGVVIPITIQGSLIGLSKRELAALVGEQVIRQLKPILSVR
jgi:hypothetical protein